MELLAYDIWAVSGRLWNYAIRFLTIWDFCSIFFTESHFPNIPICHSFFRINVVVTALLFTPIQYYHSTCHWKARSYLTTLTTVILCEICQMWLWFNVIWIHDFAKWNIPDGETKQRNLSYNILVPGDNMRANILLLCTHNYIKLSIAWYPW